MRDTFKRLWIALGSSLSLICLAACESSSSPGNTSIVVDTPADHSPNPTPTSLPSTSPSPSASHGLPSNLLSNVCDPFFDNPDHPGSDQAHGIVASLVY